jgi:hypothetical protein
MIAALQPVYDFLLEVEDRLKQKMKVVDSESREAARLTGSYLMAVNRRMHIEARSIGILSPLIAARFDWVDDYNLLVEQTRPEGCTFDSWFLHEPVVEVQE